MADRLSQNSQTPLEDEFLGPEEWVQAFSGINLRWEALGILFTYWSFGALSLTDGSSIVATKADRQALFLDYKENAWKCAELARDCSASNPLLVYLLYKHSLLESVHSGDASLAYWRLHADVIAVLTYLGLHNIPPKLSSQVSISLERLDEKGWGCDGKIHATTILRARTTLAFIRDAILEIALGPSPDCNKDALLELKQQQKDAILHFPEAVVYRPHDLLDLTIDAPSLYTKLLVRLEHLQNLFFIERLLRRAESPSSAALVEISIEMVSLTLTFWTHQDRLLGLQSDFEWLVMSYAAPAGGIMCMELLEQSQAHISVRAGLKRSLIVQKLSLLVGFLDWVRSSAPNGDLCSKVKSVIRHVLEETLETVQVLPGGQFDLGVDNWEESLDLDEFFNFDLMDTFDWLRPNGGSIRE
ncbi:Fc.00g044710.m01.CDS01 [Cosmosporella sp. VM-42]